MLRQFAPDVYDGFAITKSLSGYGAKDHPDVTQYQDENKASAVIKGKTRSDGGGLPFSEGLGTVKINLICGQK